MTDPPLVGGMSKPVHVVVTTKTGAVRLVMPRKGARRKLAFTVLEPLAAHKAGHFSTRDAAAAVKWAKGRGYAVRVTRSQYPFLDFPDGVLHPTDGDLLRKLNAVGRRLRRRIRVVSGRRDLGAPGDYGRGNRGTQWGLYEAYRYHGGNTAAYPNANAPHVAGVAVDCGVLDRRGNYLSIGLVKAAVRAMKRVGLCLPVGPSSVNPRGEAWHVQTLATGGAWRALY